MAATVNASRDAELSLFNLLNPEVVANPYPLFKRLREEDPVHWDPYLHTWVVTRYADVSSVLYGMSANRTPTPDQLKDKGLEQLAPLAQLMVRLMLFMDPPDHTRLRGLAAKAFTPHRGEKLRGYVQDLVNSLLDKVEASGRMDVITDLGIPVPALVTGELLGVPHQDVAQLKQWSSDFSEMLGNFQHNPDRTGLMLETAKGMTTYFADCVQRLRENPPSSGREGLVQSLMSAEIDGDRLTTDEVVASTIVTMLGGMETTTNLIANGVLSLTRHRDQEEKLRSNMKLMPSAIEEMLRFEPPSQHTARLAPEDTEIGGKVIRKRQAVMAVMAAGNRDPERFPHPDVFDIERKDNRHLAFGWAQHFCFGAPLARLEGQIAMETLLNRFENIQVDPVPLTWRTNSGLRGLTSLPITFNRAEKVSVTVVADVLV